MATTPQVVSGRTNRKFAVKQETTFGTIPDMSSGSDFCEILDGSIGSVSNDVPRASDLTDQPEGSVMMHSEASFTVSSSLKSAPVFGTAGDVLGKILEYGGFDVDASASTQVDTGQGAGSTTTFYVDVGTGGDFAIGDIVSVEDSAYTTPAIRRVTAVSGTLITVAPALPVAAQNNTWVRHGIQYRPNQDAAENADSLSMILTQDDDFAEYGSGCVPNTFEFTAAASDVAKWTVSGPAKARGVVGKDAVQDNPLLVGATTMTVKNAGQFVGPALAYIVDAPDSEAVLVSGTYTDHSDSGNTVKITRAQQGTAAAEHEQGDVIQPYFPTDTYQTDYEVGPIEVTVLWWHSSALSAYSTVETKSISIKWNNNVEQSGPFLGFRETMRRFTTGRKSGSVSLEGILTVNDDADATARFFGYGDRKTQTNLLVIFGTPRSGGGRCFVASCPGVVVMSPTVQHTSTGEIPITLEFDMRRPASGESMCQFAEM